MVLNRLPQCLVLCLGMAVAFPACQSHLSQVSPDPGLAVFEVAVRAVVSDSSWPVRIDPRIMDSVPTTFEVERDFDQAPPPTLVPAAAIVALRSDVLRRLGIETEQIEQYARCTRYLGGVPYIPLPGAPSAPVSDAGVEERRTCAARARHAAAILGSPTPRSTPENDGSWAIRVYLVSPVTRAVYDLVLIPRDGGWQVARQEDIMRVTS